MKHGSKEISFAAGGSVGIGLATGEIMGSMIIGGCAGALSAVFTCVVLSSKVEQKPFVLGGVAGMVIGAVFASTVPVVAEHLESSLKDVLVSRFSLVSETTTSNKVLQGTAVKTMDRILLPQ
ncbi:hypothetical protein [Candidatus Thiodiazotropha sp. LNASS1]|uniref:hypothetical protein n=1 Tax=Candidatus Thiodiazotropha sp. LNASS1 TaxID=3096260 RepID=UPI0034DF413C